MLKSRNLALSMARRWVALLVVAMILVTWSLPVAAEESETDKVGNTVTVYLKSGEVFSGLIVERTAHDLVIERGGYKFPVLLSEIVRVERGQPSPTVSSPQFSTAVVKYVYTGWESGEQTLYLDRVHNRMASRKALTRDVLGRTQSKSEWQIYDGKTVYTVDLERKVAITMSLEGDALTEALGDWRAIGESKGEETLLGRKCQVYQKQGITVCVWQGIPLRKTMAHHPMGEQYNFEQKVTELQVDVQLPEEPFTLPKDVTTKTMGEMVGQFETVMKGFVPSKSQVGGQATERTPSQAPSQKSTERSTSNAH